MNKMFAAVVVAAGFLSACTGGRGDGTSASLSRNVDAGEPRVVVGVIDSAVNPYHSFFYAGSDIYPDSAPSSVTPALLEELGIPPEHQIELTRTGDIAADIAADRAFWDRIRPGTPYWFKGTNLIASTFRLDEFAIGPGGSKSPHGMGTSASVLIANPEAVIFFTEVGTDGTTGLGSVTTHDYTMLHPAVDIISTSYGVSIPSTGFPLPETASFASSFESVVNLGKLHFSSGGNGSGLTPLRAGAGPWWSIGVSGNEEGTSEGRTVTSGLLPDFVSDFVQTLPYCLNCQVGTRNVGGTSFSTPRAAGVASRVLLELRRAAGHSGGIVLTEEGTALMVATAAMTVSNWELRRALEEAAYVPTLAEFDPVEAVFDIAIPVPEQFGFVGYGWGDLTATPEKKVVEAALAQFGLSDVVQDKGPGFCEFQSTIMQARMLYWDNLAIGSESFMAAPETYPYIFCDEALPFAPLALF